MAAKKKSESAEVAEAPKAEMPIEAPKVARNLTRERLAEAVGKSQAAAMVKD